MDRRRNDARFDNFTKAGLILVIQAHEREIEAVRDKISSFEGANPFVRVWRAIRGKVA